MSVKDTATPVGTGQQGAGSPAGANKDIPLHKPVSKVDEIADHAAKKGIEREHHDDHTVFTK
jgi:hypothetical protein